MDVDTRRTLRVIDREYASLACLGVGGFGSVFLARKRSGRKVALKVMPMDTSDDEEYGTFAREIESVVELNRGDSGNRDLNIVYFEDWFISPKFVCIVMQYADGGTLAQEIERKSKCSPLVPYAERRIAWYALQLCDALAFAHEKGVAHHDVKPANILIDASAGGKLLLADFGTALKPGEEAVGFTKSYASPELLASYELEDFDDLRPDKIDSFALGAVIYELLMCKKLEDLSTDQTLAQFITDGPGLEAAMTLGHMALPWLPPNVSAGSASYVGYTNELKNLVLSLLRPNVDERLLPGQLQDAFRTDRLSPLLLPNLAAAQTPKPGDVVTIDNLQLGMLVQRGPDWSDDDADGGPDSVGVIVKLDGDAQYVEAAFPSRLGQPVETICCRVGASGKYELRAGPSPLLDFVAGSTVIGASRRDGVVSVGREACENILVGQILNPNCAVVGFDESLGVAFAAPMERTATPMSPRPIAWRTEDASSFVSPREKEACPPATWRPDLGQLVNMLNTEEGNDVLHLFYSESGGLRRQDCVVQSIQRVQEKWLWDSYTRGRQKVADENWGMENEIRAFLFSPDELNNANLQNFQSCGKQFSTKSSVVHYKFNKRPAKGKLQMLLCRIVVGRVTDDPGKASRDAQQSIPTLTSHSEVIGNDLFACRGTCLAYPEYVITYEDRSPPAAPSTPRIGAAQQSRRSESKMCIICMERPVRYLTIPCGHPCLCEKCNDSKVKARLKFKCPECRSRFKSTAIIYGRVVIDE